ncbi:MAG: Flp pilus assembly protein CpaB [Bradymonadaceae bacterium]
MAKKKLLIAAVIVGLVAMGLVYLAFQQQAAKHQKLIKNQVKVVKAAQNIPAGTPLKKKQVTVDKVPKKFLPQNVLRKKDIQVYLGQPLKNEVKQGSMLVTADFAVKTSARNLAAKVPKNERAMSMSVDSVSGVSGLLQPGDRVDIIGTFPVGGEQQSVPGVGGGGKSVGYVTMTLLQNVTLLATGQKLTRTTHKGQRGGGYSTVTLSVTVEEAELLTIAQTRGDLSLLLRNPEDVQIDQIQRKTLRKVLENLELINKQRKKRQKQRPAPTKEDKGGVIQRLDENR